MCFHGALSWMLIPDKVILGEPSNSMKKWKIMVEEALHLLQQMSTEGTLPDKYTYANIFDAFSTEVDLKNGKRLHSQVVHTELNSNIVVRTAIMKMYSSCNSLMMAFNLFDTTVKRDLIAWNTIIASFCQHSQFEHVYTLYQQMLIEGVVPDEVTLVLIFSAFSGTKALRAGRELHSYIIIREYECNISVGNSLITLYGKCGNIENAKRVFDHMPERDVVTWNTLITAYAQTEGKFVRESKVSYHVFQQMLVESVIPNQVTCLGLLEMSSHHPDAVECQLLHAFIHSSEMLLDLSLGNAITNIYGKCGIVDEADHIFQQMSQRDESSWNAMISTYVHNGQPAQALNCFQQMEMECVFANTITYVNILNVCSNESSLLEGKRIHARLVNYPLQSNVILATALSEMYGKCGMAQVAEFSFNQILDRDMVSLNAMCKMYSQHGLAFESLHLLQKMKENIIQPSYATFSSILLSCSHAGHVSDGCYSFLFISHQLDLTPTLKQYNIMMDLFGRAGLLNCVQHLLDNMPCQPSTTSWLTLLDSCRKYASAPVAKIAADHIFELESTNVAAKIMLSQVCLSSPS